MTLRKVDISVQSVPVIIVVFLNDLIATGIKDACNLQSRVRRAGQGGFLDAQSTTLCFLNAALSH